MQNCPLLSNVTKKYLCRFDEILKNMIEEMTDSQLTDSISHNFIVQMIPHHRAAVEMSENLLKYTTLVPLQNIAQNIITEQTKSIENMKSILEQCSNLSDSRDELCCYQKSFNSISSTMFCKMQNVPSVNNINCNFIREMIPHHEGAIQMSENALRYSICPQLIPILDSIIVSQQKGVCQMKKLLYKCC